MHKFTIKVQNYIERHALLSGELPIVVAISGGADSVALLSVLTDLGYDCVAAHCNFHLRGDESMRDMYHVKAIATQLDVHLEIEHFDVPEQMRNTGQSVEMACRELRYDWFRRLTAKYSAQAIAVGHHREDQVETFMLNLLRGTGISGLTGMSASTGDVVRPLLESSRAEIEEYLAERGLDYIVDSSNAQNDFKRNRLRNIIIPRLEQHFDGATSAILTTMSHLTDNKALYDYAVQTIGNQYIGENKSINIEAMRTTLPHAVMRILLFEILKPYGFNITHVENIIGAKDTSVFSTQTHRGELSRGVLSISEQKSANKDGESYVVNLRENITAPVCIAITRHDIADFAPKRDNSTIYLDEKVLSDNPIFELRHWSNGDAMQPFGMNGSKLVSDIFADSKLSAQQKREAWLLTRNGHILWIVGMRASRLFAVDDKTKNYLRLSI